MPKKDKKEWQIKKHLNVLLFVILITIISIPFIYIFCQKPGMGFWNNAMGNMLATVLALIAGVPLALWIDRYAKSIEEKNTYMNAREKEREIISLIREELNFSLVSLFLPKMKGNLSTINIQPLKADLWEALISSDETKYIEDPELLNKITSAYYVLRTVRSIEEQAYIALRTSAITFTLHNGTKSNSAQLLLKDARGLDKLFEDNMQEAIKAVDERLIQITNGTN
ncbi:MAG: hypothetical protein KKA19_05170 [Candidatus Margulisbacteria bacterium]|nr:hypothetical protein [Candidatus Margulisiibacteriota bacterium]